MYPELYTTIQSWYLATGIITEKGERPKALQIHLWTRRQPRAQKRQMQAKFGHSLN